MYINSKLTSIGCNLQQTKGFVTSVVVVVMVSAAMCSCGDNKKGIEVVDASSALKAHRAFLKKDIKYKRCEYSIICYKQPGKRFILL